MCAALSAAGAAAVGVAASLPTDQEIFAGDYTLLRRVGTDYSPSFVELVTGLNERAAATKPPAIFNAENPLFLQWMEYRFFQEHENMFDEVWDLSQQCVQYDDFKALLTRETYIIDTVPTDLQGKVAYMNQRLNVHKFFLEQLTGMGNAIVAQIQSVPQGTAVPAKLTQARDMVIDKTRAHQAAFAKLNEAYGGSAQLIADIAQVRINFSIKDNVSYSYAEVSSQLTQMMSILTTVVGQYNAAPDQGAKDQAAEGLKNVRAMVKVMLSDEVWKGSSEFAKYHEMQYEDAILNFMFHKRSESDTPFAEMEALVKRLRNYTAQADNLLK